MKTMTNWNLPNIEYFLVLYHLVNYEGYEYMDSENLYTYPNSAVLINKQGITDPEKAQQNEHLLVTKRLTDLRIRPIEILSIQDVWAVHRYLFQDLYEWAGQYHFKKQQRFYADPVIWYIRNISKQSDCTLP